MNIFERMQELAGVNENVDVDLAVRDLVDFVQKLNVDHFKKMGYTNITPPTIRLDKGSKYWRVVKDEENNRSVWGFVNTENGDILFPRGWKAPDTKNPRGNIYDKSTWKGFTNHGPQYLR